MKEVQSHTLFKKWIHNSKVKSDAVIDIDIQNEIIRLKDRVNNLETLSKTRFHIIENSTNELLTTIL